MKRIIVNYRHGWFQQYRNYVKKMSKGVPEKHLKKLQNKYAKQDENATPLANLKIWQTAEQRKETFQETLQLIRKAYSMGNLDADRAKWIYEEYIKKYNLHLPVLDYVMVLYPIVQTGDVDIAFELYKRMKNEKSCPINHQVVHLMMRCLSEHDGDHLSCLNRANYLINQECKKFNIKITTLLVNEFMRALGKHKDVKKAMRIFNILKGNLSRFRTDQNQEKEDYVVIEEGDHILNELLQDEEMEEMDETDQFGKDGKNQNLEAARLIPDSYTYGILLELLVDNDRYDKAIELLDSIPKKFAIPMIFNLMFKSISHKEICPSEHVLRIYQKMLILGVQPTAHTFSLIIKIIPEKTFDIYRELMIRKVVPDALLMSEIFVKLIEFGHWEEAVSEVLQIVPEKAISPIVFYKMVTNILSQPKCTKENVEQLLEYMRRSGYDEYKIHYNLKDFLMKTQKVPMYTFFKNELARLKEEIQTPARKHSKTPARKHSKAPASQANSQKYAKPNQDAKPNSQSTFSKPPKSRPPKNTFSGPPKKRHSSKGIQKRFSQPRSDRGAKLSFSPTASSSSSNNTKFKDNKSIRRPSPKNNPKFRDRSRTEKFGKKNRHLSEQETLEESVSRAYRKLRKEKSFDRL